jgi:acyl carrier protein
MINSRPEIRDRLNKVFRDVFNDEKIEIFDGMTARDIDEWDSLMHITLIVATEKEFKIRLNAAQIGKLDNVGSLMDLIVKQAK